MNWRFLTTRASSLEGTTKIFRNHFRNFQGPIRGNWCGNKKTWNSSLQVWLIPYEVILYNYSITYTRRSPPEVGRFTTDYHRFTTDTQKHIYILQCICGKSVVVYGKSAHLRTSVTGWKSKKKYWMVHEPWTVHGLSFWEAR